MATASQVNSARLLESGLRELELLFRAVHQHSSQPVVLTDDNRKCLDSSVGLNKLLGLSRDRLIERRLDDFVAPGFRPQLERQWAQFLDEGELAESYPLLVSGGAQQEIGYVARARVLPGQHLLVLRTGIPAKPAPEAKQGHNLVPSWVKDAALLLLDADGNVAAWYSGAERIYGYSGQEVVGQPLSLVYDDDSAPRRELAKTASVGRLGSEGWHQAKDGSRFWARVITTALTDDIGRLQGFAVIVRDFSDRHGSDATSSNGFRSHQMRPSSEVGVLSGEYDKVSDATDRFLDMVGYSHEELVGGWPYWPELTPPEYSVQDELAYEEALIHLACTPFEKEYIRKDGTRVQVLVTVAVLSTNPFRWTKFVQDLTVREGTAGEGATSEEAASEAEPARLTSFAEIVGESSQLQRVFDQIELVAPTDATVLILGETGTGKELTARAIHRLSDRRDQPFISLNCAALPAGLLESELFGYERGAFTGALARKLGRFEMANGGTLFLDEVGDIPLDLQPKLLRALQEKEFERLGGTRTIPINVRLVAATNRNLTQMMGDHLFRSDLYYRLKVFPIVMPPLRDHPTDIPLLARYFVQKYAQQMRREVVTIPAETMRTLVRWPWPGNVRELENFMERSVILSRGTTLSAPLAEIREHAAAHVSGSTLEEVEREHIIHVLKESEGVVSTAAKRLGMPRTTLNAMMRKLGITRKML